MGENAGIHLYTATLYAPGELDMPAGTYQLMTKTNAAIKHTTKWRRVPK